MTFPKRAEFFLAEMNAQRDERGGRKLLGDNIGGWAVVLWPIGFQYVAVWISAGLPFTYLYISLCVLNSHLTHTSPKVGECLHPTLQQNGRP